MQGDYVTCAQHAATTISADGAALEGTAEQERRRAHLAATGNPAAVVPFGITLLAPAWADEYVAGVAAAYGEATKLSAGPAGHGVTPYQSAAQ